MKDKRILITGASGFLGKNFYEYLLKMGFKKENINFHYNTREPQVNFAYEHFNTIQADLTNKVACDGMIYKTMPQIVFHFAATTSGANVMQNSPLVHVTPNVKANANLLESCYFAGVEKFVFISSSTVYPDGEEPMTEDRWLEGDPFYKYFPVGWMKRYTEVLCRMYSEFLNPKMQCIVIRPSNAYGPYDKFDPNKSHVLPALIRKIAKQMEPFEIWGDGKDIRDVIYIEDLCEAIYMATEKLENYETLNIGMGEGYSINEILEELFKISGYRPKELKYDTSKPTMIPKRLIDISKAEKLIGWKPKHSLNEGLTKTWKWYIDNLEIKQ